MSFSLDDLAKLIRARSEAAQGTSYTKSLLDGGRAAHRQEVRRRGDRDRHRRARRGRRRATSEIADVLYHLLVLMEARGIALASVLAELERRTAQSGLAEKASQERRPMTLEAVMDDAEPRTGDRLPLSPLRARRMGSAARRHAADADASRI